MPERLERERDAGDDPALSRDERAARARRLDSTVAIVVMSLIRPVLVERRANEAELLDRGRISGKRSSSAQPDRRGWPAASPGAGGGDVGSSGS